MDKRQPVEIDIPDEVDQVALCGGPYSNFASTAAFLDATKSVQYRFCLGDIPGCAGAFPDRTIGLLRDAGVVCVQGNYDQSVGAGAADCGCGYSDSRDVYYSHLSYAYCLKATSPDNRAWLRDLSPQVVLKWRGNRILLAHGSPDQVNEFVWETQTTDARVLDFLNRYYCTGICVTHSGLPWVRQVRGLRQGFWFNVGVLGRPAHDGTTGVWYGVLDFPTGAARPTPRAVPLAYDPTEVVAAMRSENLPDEFVQALLRGVWTTGDHILPATEKAVRARICEVRR